MSAREAFEPAGFFVLRVPLLPFDDYLTWKLGDSSDAQPSDGLNGLPVAPRDVLAERLKTIALRPEVREALHLASPGFEGVATRWARSGAGAEDPVVLPLTRYFLRMTSRATPFGLFASVTTGTVGPTTRLILPGRAEAVRRTRLDHLVLTALIEEALRRPGMLRRCPVVPSSSLHRAGDRLHFIRYRTVGYRRVYELAAVEATPFLETTLERARSGATVEALATVLADDDVSEQEVLAYLLALCDRQILVPDVGVALTGEGTDEELARFLQSVPEASDVGASLDRVRGSLSSLDEAGVGLDPARYDEPRSALADLRADLTLERTFQCDLARPAPGATLGVSVTREIARCLELLERLPIQPHAHAVALGRFAATFVERYGEREMPLAEVLDEDVGIGYRSGPETSPILDGIGIPGPIVELPGSQHAHPAVLEKVWAAVALGETEIAFEPEDLEPLLTDEAPPLPDALVVVAKLVAPSDGASDAGDFRVFLRTAVGPSGASLLGRFCHVDGVLERNVRSFLADEEARRPDAVFAEVVHLPQGRTGNVLSRPVLRRYEIPFLGRSGAARERQIPYSDLLVSVRNGVVVLRSKRLGVEVVPRLSTAHDFTQGSLAAYRFLGALQHQGSSPRPGWDWGALAAAPFLPRVRVGRVVLARARWRLGGPELQALRSARGDERLAEAAQLRAGRRLPEQILFRSHEGPMLVDTTNPLALDALLDDVRGRDFIELEEPLPGTDQLCVTGPEGRFFHELIIPFLRRLPSPHTAVAPSPTRVGPRTETSPREAFLPGSEWLSAKLYCGPAEADRVLVHHIGPLVRRLLDGGVVRSWFFLRYRDPDFHLRVRFHGDPDRLRAEALAELAGTCDALVSDGRVRTLVLDTYERETDRYGGPAAIAHAEELFHEDSEGVLEALGVMGPGGPVELRFQVALLGVDRLLDDFELGLPERLELVRGLRDAFIREFGGEGWFPKRAAAAFRVHRARLEAITDPSAEDPTFAPYLDIHGARSARRRSAAAALRAATLAHGVRAPGDVAGSVVHMHVNRMLRSAHRQHELVLYDFLVRLYESRRARDRSARRS